MSLFFDKQKTEAIADLKCAVKLNPSFRVKAEKDEDFEKLWKDRDFKKIVTTNDVT
jgi:hypothetical protein